MPPRDPNGRSSLCRSSCTHVQRNLERLERRTRRRQTGREPRDLARDRQVALQVRRRNREDVGEVVEAAVRRLVAGQQRLHVDVEREQVANRVAVFRAVEAMDRADPAGIRIGRPRPVDARSPASRHGAIGGRIGTRPSGRRHRAGSKLRDHLFPDLSIRTWPCDVQAVERESGRAQPLVVAGDAVLVEDPLGPGGRRRAGPAAGIGGPRSGRWRAPRRSSR